MENIANWFYTGILILFFVVYPVMWICVSGYREMRDWLNKRRKNG